jgi:hypothetical protein
MEKIVNAQLQFEYMRERDHLRDVGVDRGTVLKFILRKELEDVD